MTPQFIEEMKQLMMAEKEKLEKELSQFSHRNPQTTTSEVYFPNLGDEEGENALEVARYSDNLSLEDALDKSLRDIEGAFKRIKEGTYGMCMYCKQEIDERRLRARPTSSSCIQCKKTLTQEM
ncbi:MAG: Transcriptional regulator, TraR/DksA family [Candidatus Uhrbacteria bacterium GW2011_GWF2_41_16]|jgi:DnaK suppressor protein|uniref:Transcriptional regulator, TraR/DksA family n=2 Tax=Candidatus Uhriibacteriota TaxID=1752732 RepID=A0A0G0VDS9_9BACT|nr:MAG: Transcriptional regulator, TraR/DksA family [Candidatus Uhrbacteria bacterium GW2011_GWC2_41_11]KKR97816.1 MAG: Transcriptional regulator, TraR/DksA family [Candidatus Uhrbacteria bacterium GW2011_GWF2_41_16]HBP00520.1 hypothetical protein [Candidatus Uhrbacteria bacterium]